MKGDLEDEAPTVEPQDPQYIAVGMAGCFTMVIQAFIVTSTVVVTLMMWGVI